MVQRKLRRFQVLPFWYALLKALLQHQARNWRVSLRPEIRFMLILGGASQVRLIADALSMLPTGSMATAFAYPFDGVNWWLLCIGAVFGAIAAGYGLATASLAKSLLGHAA